MIMPASKPVYLVFYLRKIIKVVYGVLLQPFVNLCNPSIKFFGIAGKVCPVCRKRI